MEVSVHNNKSIEELFGLISAYILKQNLACNVRENLIYKNKWNVVPYSINQKYLILVTSHF